MKASETVFFLGTLLSPGISRSGVMSGPRLKKSSAIRLAHTIRFVQITHHGIESRLRPPRQPRRMLNKDTNIDRHTCTRVVPLQVLGLGFSRTGTLSMQKAIENLGYQNPYHFCYGRIHRGNVVDGDTGTSQEPEGSTVDEQRRVSSVLYGATGKVSEGETAGV
jgi:hypothetical protein